MSKHNKKTVSLQVLKKFRIIYGTVRQHFREIEQSCGVTGSQLWIMQEIARTPGIGVSLLAEQLSVHQSTCSQLVEKLVTRELIIKERSKEDQRRVGLHLSAEARSLMKHAPAPTGGLLPQALRALPEEAILALDEALEKVLEQLASRDELLAGRPLSDL